MRFGWLALLPLVAAFACGGTKKHAEDPSSTTTTGEASHDGPAEVGKPAPDLAIQPLNAGQAVKLDALAGKVVVVDFWATWCGPCRQSFPGLQALSKRYEGQVAVVGVSVNDEQDGITDFAKELGTTFPIGWDKGHTIADRWKVASMPSSYVVDGTGTVRFVHSGYHDGDEAEIEKEVASLLGKAPAPTSGDKADKKPEPEAAASTPANDDTKATIDTPKSTTQRARPTRKTTKKKSKKKKPTATPDT